MPSDSQPVTEEMVATSLGKLDALRVAALMDDWDTFGTALAELRASWEAAQAVAPPKAPFPTDAVAVLLRVSQVVSLTGNFGARAGDGEKLLQIAEVIEASPAAPATEEPLDLDGLDRIIKLANIEGQEVRIVESSPSGASGTEERAIRDVLAERVRQRSELGWTEGHDDDHVHGEIAKAACAFVSSALGCPMTCEGEALEMWKSHRSDRTPREKLVRAAALLLAEIGRRDRAMLRSVHINTRDESGVSKPISPSLANAVEDAAKFVQRASAPAGEEPSDWRKDPKVNLARLSCLSAISGGDMDAPLDDLCDAVAALHSRSPEKPSLTDLERATLELICTDKTLHSSHYHVLRGLLDRIAHPSAPSSPEKI